MAPGGPPPTGDLEVRPGKSAVAVPMTRGGAGYLRDVLRHYERTGDGGPAGRLCRETLGRMGCPRPDHGEWLRVRPALRG